MGTLHLQQEDHRGGYGALVRISASMVLKRAMDMLVITSCRPFHRGVVLMRTPKGPRTQVLGLYAQIPFRL